MNLTTYATANGISLKKSESNLLAKLEKDYGLVTSNNTVVSNPYTGVVVNTNPLIAALIAFAITSYKTYSFSGTMNYLGKKVAVGTWDRTRYLVMKLDADTYYKILD